MRNLLICFALFFSLDNLQAQQKPNFSGSFTIDKSKTDFGDIPEYALPVSFEVVQDGNTLTITRNTIGKEGEQRSFTETITLGGDSVKSAIPVGLHRTAIADWNTDQKTFTIKSNSRSADQTTGIKLTEIWSLSDDGKTLELDRDALQADGVGYKLQAFYEKSN